MPQLGVFAEIPLKAERILGTELIHSKLKSLAYHCPSVIMVGDEEHFMHFPPHTSSKAQLGKCIIL